MWKLLSSEYLIKRPWLTARKDKLQLPNGKIIPEYYVLEYPDWVNIIAVTKENLIVMERQYRHGANSTNYEIPSGIIEKDETPLEAGQRELLEETGYGGGEWQKIMILSANPTMMTNMNHCFLAVGVEKVSDQHLDETECLDVFLKSRDEVIAMLDNNEMIHPLMVAPLMKYFIDMFFLTEGLSDLRSGEKIE